jgi:sensor histidine kinase YesM
LEKARPSILQHPLIKENWPYFWFFLALVVLIDVLTMLVKYLNGLPVMPDLYSTLISISLLVIPMIAVNVIFLFKQAFAHRLSRNWQVLILKVLGMVIGISFGTMLFELIYAHLGYEDDDYIVLGSLQFSATTSEYISNLFYALFIGVPIFLSQQRTELARKEVRLNKEQLEKANRLHTQAQLEALQAKVNPHFLYNALNSIASLIHTNPNRAEEMVLSLSELFRYSLNQNQGRLSSIEDEVKMVETYMSIELVRFQEQLDFQLQVEEGLGQFMIPRFLLQPMVENAIKHGTSKMKKGQIRLNIWSDDNQVFFSIADSGPAFPDSFSIGYGVRSVTDQLELLYPGMHDFQMLNAPHKHVLIALPKTMKE